MGGEMDGTGGLSRLDSNLGNGSRSRRPVAFRVDNVALCGARGPTFVI